MSEILTHDSLFVKDCIEMIVKEILKNRFKQVSFWSDNGRHFRSSELMNYLYDLAQKHFDFVSMNFFVEYHGKNLVDANFGILQKALNEGEKKKYIKTLDELLDYFRKYFLNSNFYFSIYNRKKRPKKLKKLIIKKFKFFLSFIFLKKLLYMSIFTTNDIENWFKMVYDFNETLDNRTTKYSYTGRDNNVQYLLINNGTRDILDFRIPN